MRHNGSLAENLDDAVILIRAAVLRLFALDDVLAGTIFYFFFILCKLEVDRNYGLRGCCNFIFNEVYEAV